MSNDSDTIAFDVQVYKFGGTSLADAKSICQVMSIISKSNTKLVVVVSAMAKMTDLMLNGLHKAAKGQLDSGKSVSNTFEAAHLQVIQELFGTSAEAQSLNHHVSYLAREYETICESIAVLHELTDRTIAKALSRGERMMAKIVGAALNAHGHKSMVVDATQILKVEASPLGMYPITTACDQAAQTDLIPHLEGGVCVIVPGFIAEGPDAELVLLGRGGSDFSASIIASSLKASSLTLYKEVDGLMTADPRHVDRARIIENLHYREAAELAYYGAKILHPCTIIPLSIRQIPLHIKNTFFPDRIGTRIDDNAQLTGYPVKALTAIEDQAVIAVEGKGMMGVPGVAGRTFSSLARGNISVTMISQASSESSICFVVSAPQAQHTKQLLEQEFKFEINNHLIDGIKIKSTKSIIAIVGLGMSGTPGTGARVFSAIAKEGINVEVIAQGSSELNISVVIDKQFTSRALNALHREFRLEKSHTLPAVLGNRISIGLLGFGQIGTTLVEQIVNQRNILQHQIHADLAVVNISDTTACITAKMGFSDGELLQKITAKRQKEIPIHGNRLTLDHTAICLQKDLWQIPFAKGIFVDCTAADTMPLIIDALNADMHIVLANKKPMAADDDAFYKMMETAKSRKRQIRYEATVGAGLPVLDTLAKLSHSGDQVEVITGCLSGTLGFIMTQLEGGVNFSKAIEDAHHRGYTEPDPRDDLSGVDVARKALILARTLGHRLNLRDVHLEPLIPGYLENTDLPTFMSRIAELDEDFQAQVQKAREQNKVLRYVARISKDHIWVGLEHVSQSSPLGQLQGTDNQVVIKSRFYHSNPLIVTGPGAGADVTAAGVLNDIIAIAQTQDSY